MVYCITAKDCIPESVKDTVFSPADSALPSTARPSLSVKVQERWGCSVPKVPWAASGVIEVKVKINTNDKKAASVLLSLFNFIIKISVTQAVPKHRQGTLS